MALSSELASQFAKVTNDSKRTSANNNLHGTIVAYGEELRVQIDGSDEVTPISRTVEVSEGDRVEVTISNHTATVNGNTTHPSMGTMEDGVFKSTISQTAEEIKTEVENMTNGMKTSITQNAEKIESLASTTDGLQSTITQTAEQIRSEVADTKSELQSSITQNSNEISMVVQNQDAFSQFQQTVEGFSFMGSGGEVKIGFADLDDQTQDLINSTGDGSSSNIDPEFLETLEGWVYPGSTFINGTRIYTGTVTASKLQAGQVSLLDASGLEAGVMGLTSASSTEGKKIALASAAIELEAQGGAIYLETPGGDTNCSMQIYRGYIGEKYAYGVKIENGSIYPGTDNTYACGLANSKWSNIYCYTCTGTSSDENQKNNIEVLPDKYLAMMDAVEAKRFKLNEGTSDRYHVGFIAQDVEAAMANAGIDSTEFGGWIKDYDEDGKDIYMLRYGEFVGILWAKIRQLESRIKELETVLQTTNE